MPNPTGRARTALLSVWESPVFRIVLLATNLLLLMLHLWDLSPFGRKLDYQAAGNVADWFTGLLTLGAVSVAALALRADRERFFEETLRREQEKREVVERATEDERLRARAEAAQAYAWLQVKRDSFGRTVGAEFHVQNRSALPVYQWRAEVTGTELAFSQEEEGPLIPGHSRFERTGPEWVKLFEVSATQRVTLTFLGANGETLRRAADGTLEVVK